MSHERRAQGAFPTTSGTTFRVWAPRTESLSLLVDSGSPLPMERDGQGFFEARLTDVRAGARYLYVFPDGRKRADPASRLQEGSVHGPSTVVDLAFGWSDQGWRGVELERLVLYEVHVGTFTPEGTLEAIIPRLAALKELGVTAVELMPLAAFDGDRGWGYDGVLPYAVHAPYGGPRALQRLVDAAHALGLGVLLDVVYNHLGPSGCYVREFGPYFTDRHQTPWGEAVNFDGEGAGPVRELFIDNALSWVRDFHLDGLRLDAIHGICDESPRHIVAELNDRVRALAARLGRQVHVIAESDLNDPVVVQLVDRGGWGLAAQWSDDFHHALHSLLTGERTGYYADFGEVEHLAKAYSEAFVLDGGHSVFRKQSYGRSARGLAGRRFVVCAQNHDQVGNRLTGDRLAASLPPEALRLAAAATLLSPFLPLLFMGEEYGERAPFQYFTSFPDPELGRAVRQGRSEYLRTLAGHGEMPDPQAQSTFERSRIDLDRSGGAPGQALRSFYQAALLLRRSEPALAGDAQQSVRTVVFAPRRALLVHRQGARGEEAALVLHLSPESTQLDLPSGPWRVALDSWAPEFAGPSPHPLPEKIQDGLKLGPWHAALLIRER